MHGGGVERCDNEQGPGDGYVKKLFAHAGTCWLSINSIRVLDPSAVSLPHGLTINSTIGFSQYPTSADHQQSSPGIRDFPQ